MIRLIYENEEPTKTCLAPNSQLRCSVILISIVTLILRNDVITLHISFVSPPRQKKGVTVPFPGASVCTSSLN